MCFSSENLFHFKRDQTKYSIKPADYAKLPLFLEDKASSAYLNDFFCYIMSKVGEWRGMRGVRADDTEDIKYLFTSEGDGTERGKGLPAMTASKSGPALATSALVSKRFVAYLASFLGVSFYLKTTDPRVSRAIDVLYGMELQRLGAVDDKVFEDYVLRKMTARYERYPPKKGKKGDGDEESREDEDDAKDGEDGGAEYVDVAQLQPSNGE